MNTSYKQRREMQTLLEHTQGKKESQSSSLLLSGLELSELTEETDNVFYFGVLTPGEKAELIFKGNSVKTVEPGERINEVFTSLNFTDEAGTGTDPKGLFRGCKITLK